MQANDNSQPVNSSRISRSELRSLVRNPLQFFLTLAKQGDFICYRPAPEPAYLVNHPDAVKQILSDKYRSFSKETYINQMFKTTVGDGLLTSEGSTWLKQRRLMQPTFHHQQMAKLDGLIADATQSMLDRWQDFADRHEPIYLASEIAALTLTITTKALLGVDLGEEINKVGRAVDKGGSFLEKPNHPLFHEGIQIVNQIVQRILTERRDGSHETGDLLWTLMQARDDITGKGMTDEQLRNQIITLLLAGYETTSSALTWSWYLLSQHPDVVNTMRTEVKAVVGRHPPASKDQSSLSYTKMVFEESMRLFPPAWMMGRKALKDEKIGNQLIPANSVIAISPYVLHRHPRYWEDPERFDPLRFSPEQQSERHRFVYIPFGAGPRQCIGNPMAYLEAQIILPMITQRFNLHLVDDHPIKPEAVFVLRPDKKMKMELETISS